MEMSNSMIEKVKAVIAAPSCCAELRAVAEEWLQAVGTDGEKEASAKLVAELEEDVTPIDSVIAFFGTDTAAGIFGPEGAAKMLAHMKEVKAAGGEWCDCGACSAGKKILDRREELF